MRRVALLLLGIVTTTWLQFEFFPGHTYLQGESQTYLPILERLDAPGYLSRDLVATHPDVAYTIYDEVTLLLHEAGRMKFKNSLEAQQLFCRAAGIAGVLLLALSTGIGDLPAFLIAMFVNLGATLGGPALLLIDPEPVPRAFAFGLILLAAGLLVEEKPLLAGLTGGIALLYHPVIAAPLWGVVLIAFAFDARLRRLFRPALTILLIFILLLANLAQLQPGVVESEALLGRIAAPIAELQQYRTPYVWVSLWSPADLWNSLAIYVCGVWATTRIWQSLNRPLRLFLIALPLAGVLSVAASYLALERLQWYQVPRLQPAQTLLFTVALSSLACGVAGARAAAAGKKWEATLWFSIVFALPVNTRIFDLLRVNSAAHLREFMLCVTLALAAGVTLTQWRRNRWRQISLLVSVSAVFLLHMFNHTGAAREMDQKPLLQLADWAETGTWGSSMFLFPDAGRDLYPGTFRAASRRALWVDWSSGSLVDSFDTIAAQWWERWPQTMESSFSPQRLEKMLSLPIDYYVLKRSNQLKQVRPVFQNREFVVYDAEDLRRAPNPLRFAASHAGS